MRTTVRMSGAQDVVGKGEEDEVGSRKEFKLYHECNGCHSKIFEEVT